MKTINPFVIAFSALLGALSPQVYAGTAAEQLAGVALQTPLQAVGKKAHRRQGRDGECDRHHQQAQFPRAHIAPQSTPT